MKFINYVSLQTYFGNDGIQGDESQLGQGHKMSDFTTIDGQAIK